MAQAEPTIFTDDGHDFLPQIEQVLSGFPLDDPTDESLTDKLDELRAKFRVLLSVLGAQHEVMGSLRQAFRTGSETTPEGKTAGADLEF